MNKGFVAELDLKSLDLDVSEYIDVKYWSVDLKTQVKFLF